MRNPVSPLAAVVVLIAAASFVPPATAAERSPVVVELFTSQGCSSCPPPDAVLGELAQREEALPLSFHVTYWDRLGWRDTFGLEDSTRCQRAYADWLGLNGLYTPQMVIGGRIDVVGSRRERVSGAIQLLIEHGEPGPPIDLEPGWVRIGAGAQGAATVWLAAFDAVHEVAISRGENRGRKLRYYNVVREVIELGRWSGAPASFALPLERLASAGREGAALLVQRECDGAILTAARLDPTPG